MCLPRTMIIRKEKRVITREIVMHICKSTYAEKNLNLDGAIPVVATNVISYSENSISNEILN